MESIKQQVIKIKSYAPITKTVMRKRAYDRKKDGTTQTRFYPQEVTNNNKPRLRDYRQLRSILNQYIRNLSNDELVNLCEILPNELPNETTI